MVASTHTCVTCNHSHTHIGMHLHTYLLTHSCINIPAHTLTHDTHAHTHTQIHACVHPYHTHISTDTHAHTQRLYSHMHRTASASSLSLPPHTVHTHILIPIHMCTQLLKCMHSYTLKCTQICTHTYTHILDCQGTTHMSQTQSAIVKTAQPLIKSSFFILHMNWPTSTSLPHSTQ